MAISRNRLLWMRFVPIYDRLFLLVVRRREELSILKEKDWLKPNEPKLKNLGLTISHEVGYSLSPRGEMLLNYLETHPS